MEYLEIYLLEQLAAFHRCGTLSAAAEELMISQPALSRSMQKLEKLCGVSLFTREKKRIHLNETGKLAAAQAEHILRMEQEMLNLIRNFDRSQRTISIGSCTPGPLMEFPGMLSSLYDGMSISSEMAEENDLLNGLENDHYQLVILTHPVDDPLYYSQACGSEHLFISVIPAHPAAVYKDKGVTFKEMNGETFLMNAHIGTWDAITRKNMPDSNLLLQNDAESLLKVINASTLPSFATDLTLRVMPGRTGRVNVPFTDPDATMHYYCVCKAEQKKRFRDWFALLKEQTEQHAADDGR